MGDRGPHQAARISVARAVDRGYEGLFAGRCALFDGTFIQTPAMGEDYLRALLDKDTHNAFLRTRLGNLFRGCGEKARASEWYEKSLALDAGVLPDSATGLGVAQIHGCTCAPANTGPPMA